MDNERRCVYCATKLKSGSDKCPMCGRLNPSEQLDAKEIAKEVDALKVFLDGLPDAAAAPENPSLQPDTDEPAGAEPTPDEAAALSAGLEALINPSEAESAVPGTAEQASPEATLAVGLEALVSPSEAANAVPEAAERTLPKVALTGGLEALVNPSEAESAVPEAAEQASPEATLAGGLEALVNPSEAANAVPEATKQAPPVSERQITNPTTIEELKLYCAQKGMPLERMRFFIGVDYRRPRAFGIYRDGNAFVVYKNKDNGERAIRYRGIDERHAVNELYQKLLSECALRGIYPNGAPSTVSQTRPDISSERKRQMELQWLAARKRKRVIRAVVICVILILLYLIAKAVIGNSGYYRINDRLYYRNGNAWYEYSGSSWGRYYGYFDDYDDYYLGYSYSYDYGGSDVKRSSVWEDDHRSSSSDYRDDDDWGSSSDSYDSWDSGDTDWGSDW